MTTKYLLFVVCMLYTLSSQAAVWTITYPKSEIENDVRYDYPLALLELALQKTGVRYKLKPSDKVLRQAKALKRLEENLEINILWSMTDNNREQQLRPIRIPIAKGLIGWRVFVTHKNSKFLTAKIDKLEALFEFTAVQGMDWPDTKILQANGINVLTSRDYMDASQMLNNNVADYFPRSVVEVLPELTNKYSANFRLRKGLAFQYPTAQYFFTNSNNITLSKLIETGLNRAIDDGSYEELFQLYYGETLKILEFQDITYFRLENPLLPALTPTAIEKYWYSLPE